MTVSQFIISGYQVLLQSGAGITNWGIITKWCITNATYIGKTKREFQDISVLKPLHNKKVVDKTVYNKLSPSGSRPGVMYSLSKVNKKCINGSSIFRPILAAIDISTYNLAHFLVTLLGPLTSNDFTVKDSFTFAEELRSQDQNMYMATLDVDSLFTNFYR